MVLFFQAFFGPHTNMPTANRPRSLDERLADVLLDIADGITGLNKHARIRCEKWVQRLSEPETNIAWKRNNCAHACLLLRMVRNQVCGNVISDVKIHLAYT